MKDLDIKVPWLTKARLDFFKGGLSDGSLGITLTFSGRPVDSTTLAPTLSSLLACSLPAARLVRLTGTFPSHDDGFEIFIKALQKYEFTVHAIVEQNQLGTWIDNIKWVILRTKDPLLMFAPNEVWYSPSEDEGWKDITMPANPTSPTFMYFDRTKRVESTEEFFISSKYHWQLL